MTTKSPSKYDDIIDSRDILARIDELFLAAPLDNEERAELQSLQAVANEASSSPDWHHGETLIRDSYFREYAQDLAEECGLINPDAHWPNDCIDWDRAARELQVDYFPVDFDGVTYWIRG